MFVIPRLGRGATLFVTVIIAATIAPGWAAPPVALPDAGADGSEMAPPGSGGGPPTLEWCGTPGYVTDGVDPDRADAATVFTWCVLYRSARNTPPAEGSPKVLVSRGGIVLITRSMTPGEWVGAIGDYVAGRRYTHAQTLAAGDYGHKFTASDAKGRWAWSLSGYGPEVYPTPMLGWCPGWTGGIDPTEGDTNTTFLYCVDYVPSPGDDPWWYSPIVRVWWEGELWFEDWTWCDYGDGDSYFCYYETPLQTGSFAYQFEVTSSSGLTVRFPDPPGGGPVVT